MSFPSRSLGIFLGIMMLTACVAPNMASSSGIAPGIRITVDGKKLDFGKTTPTYANSSFGGTMRGGITFVSSEGKADPATGIDKVVVRWSYPSDATGSSEIERIQSVEVDLYAPSNQSYAGTYSVPKPENLVLDLKPGKHGTVEGLVLGAELDLPKLGAFAARTFKIECNAEQNKPL